MSAPETKRLQGTDGVRRKAAPSINFSGSPLETFLKHDVMTEEFFELYCYAHVADQIDRGKASKGAPFVIGWDSRDTQGLYTGGAVKGISKAGGTPVIVGTLPTPGVALAMVCTEAAGAFMITASHNPKDQNGIKIFLAPNAMKMLPDDDVRLTEKIFRTDWEEVKEKKAQFEPKVTETESRELFRKFHLDLRNSWVNEKNLFAETVLVFDAAHGAMAGISGDVFRELGFMEVIEVAGERNGDVNKNSGVAFLEGVKKITSEGFSSGGPIAEHQLLQRMFGEGRKRKDKPVTLMGISFDADGDRFYTLLYNTDADTGADSIHILSGDECAAHQAAYLMETDPEKFRGTLFVHTVESDINVARYIRSLGMDPLVSAVGDKWILQQAINRGDRFGIGVEESGHSIHAGIAQCKGGERAFYSGNGLKGSINTLVAIHALKKKVARGEFLKLASFPFTPGYKSTAYSYYVKKELFAHGSEIWRGVLKTVKSIFDSRYNSGVGDGLSLVQVEIENEPDMLYLSVEKRGEGAVASLFIRNSGTEDKIGVNARGPHELKSLLSEITRETVIYLMRNMKDETSEMAAAEKVVLEAVECGKSVGEDFGSRVDFERLTNEMEMKEKIIKSTVAGYELTELGKRLIG